MDSGVMDLDAPQSSIDAAGDMGSAVPMDSGPAWPATFCNGRTAYCSLRYDELCQLATHDSAANSSDYWQFPTQAQSIAGQLASGVRVLMLSVRTYVGVVSVCRGDCTEGNTSLGLVLAVVKDFLDKNPREVVTLLIETPLDASLVEAEFTTRGLDALAYARASNAPWPTLSEMIEAGHRLVVFTDISNSAEAWLLPRQALIWETSSNWDSLSAMNCGPAVGDSSRPLYLVHHNLVESLDAGSPGEPNLSLAAVANAFATVTARLQTCRMQYGRVPNFVAVDFSSQGDAVGATQVMNGIREAPQP